MVRWFRVRWNGLNILYPSHASIFHCSVSKWERICLELKVKSPGVRWVEVRWNGLKMYYTPHTYLFSTVATPGAYTVSNFPCYEDGKNCVDREHYVDPSNHVVEVQRRLAQDKKQTRSNIRG